MIQTVRMLEANVDNKSDDEPNTLKQAVRRSDWLKLKKSMQAKFNSLINNETWELMPESKNRQVITSRWCFKLKKDHNSHFLIYKARLVAHCFKQKEYINFVEIFATVFKSMSYKCLFGRSIKRRYKIWQIDLITTFLYRFLDEIIYVEQLHLFKLNLRFVCRLCKALYGLKQAPQVWYQPLADFFKRLCLKRLELDHNVFVSHDQQLFPTIYVDNLLFFDSDDSRFTDIRDQLNTRFKITNLGEISHYFGIEVDGEVGKEISLQKTIYLRKILEHFQIADNKPASIPRNLGVANSLFSSNHQANKATIKCYQSAVGSLICLSLHTQPDISYSMGVLSRYCANLDLINCNLVDQIFWYLAGTLQLGITFNSNSEDEIVGYTDSYLDELKDEQKSNDKYLDVESAALLAYGSLRTYLVFILRFNYWLCLNSWPCLNFRLCRNFRPCLNFKPCLIAHCQTLSLCQAVSHFQALFHCQAVSHYQAVSHCQGRVSFSSHAISYT